MSARERLQKVQAALSERGVVDVKFCIQPGPTMGLTEAADDAANFMEAILQGRTTPAKKIGDSVRKPR